MEPKLIQSFICKKIQHHESPNGILRGAFTRLVFPEGEAVQYGAGRAQAGSPNPGFSSCLCLTLAPCTQSLSLHLRGPLCNGADAAPLVPSGPGLPSSPLPFPTPSCASQSLLSQPGRRNGACRTGSVSLLPPVSTSCFPCVTRPCSSFNDSPHAARGCLAAPEG